MHILYVSHTHPPEGDILENVGGMQRVSQQLIRELDRKPSVKVTKVNVNATDSFIGSLKTFLFLFRELFELPVRAQNTGADVILFSSMVTASLSYFIRNRVSVPMVTINHGKDVTYPGSLYQWFVPKVFSTLDGVISVSRATKQECVKRGMSPDKGITLPNGFDFNKLNRFPDKKASRRFIQKHFQIATDDKFILLTVGRKVKRKGHEWFVREVLPKLESEVVYVTVGDGPEFDSIERAVKESKTGNVHMLGHQPDSVLKKVYAAADLFIMPNIPVEGDMEGFGIVLLEANMARTPAVVSDLEGMKDVITEGKNGCLIPPLQAEEFANQINKVLNSNLEQFSVQARTYVRDKFSWKKVANKYVAYLRAVIDSYRESEVTPLKN